MSGLYKNAVDSIRMGIEDYQANDPSRSLSAVRNFYSGLLLLAKEVLVRAAPNATPESILGANYKPVPNGKGGVRFKRASARTLDFTNLGARFADFSLKIDQAALRDLNRIRNEVEHYFTSESRESVREAIAKAFPVVRDLFRVAKEDPLQALGGAWNIMLEVRSVYEQELRECRQTFEHVDWRSSSLENAPFNCPACNSDLVAQKDPTNTDAQEVDAQCRACGAEISADKGVERALAVYFEGESYSAAKDGDIQPLHLCPECGVTAYVISDEENGCAWCEASLEDCARCGEGLTPDNVSFDNHSLCGYCDDVMSRDD